MAQTQPVVPVAAEVLAPELSQDAILAKVAEIEQVFNFAMIPTDRSVQYFKWLDEMRLLRQCGRVIGTRLVGKSYASKHYQIEDVKKVVYIPTWSDFSSRRLFGEILKALNHAAPTGKRCDLRTRVAGCLVPFGIEIVIIDHAENLLPQALLDLKHLFEESGVPIILVGNSKLDSALADLDLMDYFPCSFRFDTLEREEFQKTLRTIERKILQLPEASNLADGTMFETLVEHTGSCMGKLVKLLPQAVLHSLANGHRKIDEATLIQVANWRGKKVLLPTLAEGEVSKSV